MYMYVHMYDNFLIENYVYIHCILLPNKYCQMLQVKELDGTCIQIEFTL